MDAAFVSRFWSKVFVRADDECWEWSACISAGYGQISVGNGKRKRAHRVSWELSFGAIPSGMLVCHRCDKRTCVNPSHLFLGTPKDNMQDMYAKKRNVRSRAKLSIEQVMAIRERSGGGESCGAIAKDYMVDRTCIWQIVSGKTWGNIQ